MILLRGNFSSKTTCAITFVCLGRACQSQKNYKGYNLLECTSVFERRGYRGLLLSFCPKGLISNSPHCLLQNSYDVSLENFVLDQLRILLSISSILITCSLDIVCFFFFFFFLQFYRFVIIATSRLFLKYLYLISLIDLPILTITSFGFTAPS